MKPIKFKHGQAYTTTHPHKETLTHTQTHTHKHCQPPRLPKTKKPEKVLKVCKVVACKKFARIAKK